ncbi:MAG: maleylpyruvate isomerase N-terminal domain-containing protein [Actinomycetota bacterium]
MVDDRDYVEANARELERMRSLVRGMGDEELDTPAHAVWTFADVLAHIAFWDARVLALAAKLERGEPFTDSDTEAEDVDWINDAARRMYHAVPPRALAELSLEIAAETDAKVASLPPDRLWPRDPDSPLYAVRANHRGEHLDEIEAALAELRSG